MLRTLIFQHVKNVLQLKQNQPQFLFYSTAHNKAPPIELNKVRTNKSESHRKEGRSSSSANEPPRQSRTAAIVFLSIPIVTFGLGVWQVKRRDWKLNLINYMEGRTKAKPLELPTDPDELEKLVENHEYKPFRVKGHFLHSKEILLSPRHDLTGRSTLPGALVITPFVLSNNPNLIILVNRGYVPYTNYMPVSRQEGQIEGECEIVGLLRSNEATSTFTPKNRPPNEWHHRDVQAIAHALNTAPIYLDAVDSTHVKGGPIAGQTAINLRNDHMTYLITWFTLSVFTSVLWWRRFGKVIF